MDPVARSRNEEALHLSAPDVEALFAAYNSLLDKLEPLCVPLPGPTREYELYFEQCEVNAVNDMWRSEGIEGVTRVWGDERKVEGSLSLSCDGRAYLHIIEFARGEGQNEKGAKYFRRRAFEAAPSFTAEFLEAVQSTGLYDRLVPERDSISGFEVRSAPITSVKCVASWYGPENMYGNGVEINVHVGLQVAPDQNIDLRITLLRDAHVHVSLFDPLLYETGYEGHDHKVAPITVPSLRALLPVLSKVPEMTPDDSKGDVIGAWRGATLSPS